MNKNNGVIRQYDEIAALSPAEQADYIPMKIAPTLIQTKAGRVGRNDPCPCGSGKKFKRCHWEKAMR